MLTTVRLTAPISTGNEAFEAELIKIVSTEDFSLMWEIARLSDFLDPDSGKYEITARTASNFLAISLLEVCANPENYLEANPPAVMTPVPLETYYAGIQFIAAIGVACRRFPDVTVKIEVSYQ